ncbi:MAG TPA: PilZ domain-containing protein [Nitrospira sp.]|nr:PilZ domain-containing protein [Nitrospira sp.]
MALRRDVRYQVQCPVAFVVDGKPGQGTTFNLLRGGCAIDTDMYAAIDDPISLHITVSSQPTPIAIELGKVRWATRQELGVEFMVVERASKQRLDDFLLVVAKEKLTS